MTDELLELINQLDENLAIIKTLAELAPLLDDAGPTAYWKHTIMLFNPIADFVRQHEILMRNLTVALRTP